LGVKIAYLLLMLKSLVVFSEVNEEASAPSVLAFFAISAFGLLVLRNSRR
jgi:hypothetical protein